MTNTEAYIQSEVSKDIKARVSVHLINSGLLKIAATREEWFTRKNGSQVPFYLDLRLMQSYPELFHTATDAYCAMVDDIDPKTRIAGIPEAGIPIATAVGFQLKAPLIQPRAVVKVDHGISGKTIEGYFKQSDEVIIIDDLVSSGVSKLSELDRFTKAGLIVRRFVVLVDNQGGGIETVREAGVRIDAAMTVSEVVNLANEAGMISAAQRDVVLDFVKPATS
jgi:orotate phosphoribosyltransferase